MAIPVKLGVFEGPLDLLLHLIEKNKVDIYDIPIVEITEQYLDYVSKMPKDDLDLASEFLVMAATLIDIKSKMLLPKEIDENGEEIDPRAELVEKLIEYKMYKYASVELRDMQVYAGKSLYKEPTIPEEVSKYQQPVDLDQLLEGVDLSKLNEIFQMVLKRQVDKIDPVRSKFGKIEMEEVSAASRTSMKNTLPITVAIPMLSNTFGNVTNIRLGPLPKALWSPPEKANTAGTIIRPANIAIAVSKSSILPTFFSRSLSLGKYEPYAIIIPIASDSE